jgi:hypothetical protein
VAFDVIALGSLVFVWLDSLGLGVYLSLELSVHVVLMILAVGFVLLLEHEVDGDIFE